MEDFIFHTVMYALTLIGGIGLGAQMRSWWTDYEIKRLRKMVARQRLEKD